MPPTGTELAIASLVVTVASYATNLAAQLGAFGDVTPENNFNDAFKDNQATADLELLDSQRRKGLRSSILAGQNKAQPLLGQPTILGVPQPQSAAGTSQPGVLGNP
jgi:hypothetical protein